MPGFPATRHSVIDRMRTADEGARGQAFGDLVHGYWKPLHRYLCLHWHLSEDEAEEATQAFFTHAFQKEWLARDEPEKARFRTFLRVCADRFVLNRRQAAARIKRGGGVETVSLEAEGELAAELASQPDAVSLFKTRVRPGAVRARPPRSPYGMRAGGQGPALRPVRTIRHRACRRRQFRRAGARVRSHPGAGDQQPRADPEAIPRMCHRRVEVAVRQRRRVPP